MTIKMPFAWNLFKNLARHESADNLNTDFAPISYTITNRFFGTNGLAERRTGNNSPLLFAVWQMVRRIGFCQLWLSGGLLIFHFSTARTLKEERVIWEWKIDAEKCWNKKREHDFFNKARRIRWQLTYCVYWTISNVMYWRKTFVKLSFLKFLKKTELIFRRYPHCYKLEAEISINCPTKQITHCII